MDCTYRIENCMTEYQTKVRGHALGLNCIISIYTGYSLILLKTN